MTKLEKLEKMRRQLQSRIAKRRIVIKDMWGLTKHDVADLPYLYKIIRKYAKDQKLDISLIKMVIEEQRIIYDYEKHLDAYWKSYEKKEG